MRRLCGCEVVLGDVVRDGVQCVLLLLVFLLVPECVGVLLHVELLLVRRDVQRRAAKLLEAIIVRRRKRFILGLTSLCREIDFS